MSLTCDFWLWHVLIDFVLKDRISGAKFLLSMQRCKYLGIGWASRGYGVHNSIFDYLMNNNANHVVDLHFFPTQIFRASYTPVMQCLWYLLMPKQEKQIYLENESMTTNVYLCCSSKYNSYCLKAGTHYFELNVSNYQYWILFTSYLAEDYNQSTIKIYCKIVTWSSSFVSFQLLGFLIILSPFYPRWNA